MTPQIIILVGIVAFCAICLLIVRSASDTGDYRPVTDTRTRGTSPLFVILLGVFFLLLLYAGNIVSGGAVAAAILG